ncbi:MAG: NAD-dependent epimerase/dehydratase family protein, partial [Gemmatimonadaceae bacterium]|nr:NAD-dependent epimerase/dehydratase family protein [Gemmatimonadaceae bacterium]
MENPARVYVAGHRGLVGSAIIRVLEKNGYTNIVTRTKKELDLRNQAGVRAFFKEEQPSVVFLAAARVGGIHANNVNRWEFLHENLQIQS